MYEVLLGFSPYAPVVLFVASVLDIFFVSGYILYGAAMMGSVYMMYTTGMISIPMIIASTYAGTMLGNTINFFSGRLFGETAFVKKRAQGPKVEKARDFLRTRGLFLFILISRFTAFLRPMYALVLGTLNIRFRRFIIYESSIALFWTGFWLIIILQSEAFVLWMYGVLR